MKQVAENPERYKHMHYDYSGSSRVRIGKVRIVFSYNKEKQIIYLEKLSLDTNMVGEDIVRSLWRHKVLL